MELKTEARPVADVEVDGLIVVGYEGAPPEGTPFADQVKELYSTGEFTGKALETAILHRPSGLKAKRLILAGAGKKDRFDSAELRKLTGAVVRSVKGKGLRNLALSLDGTAASDELTAAAVEGALLADLEANRYQTDPKKDEKRIDSFAVLGASKSGLDRGRILAEAQNFSRNLANEPANVLTPTLLAQRAREMAAEF